MIMTEKLYYLAFVLAGLVLTLPLLVTPTSSHWDISVSYLSSKMSLQEIFSNFYWYPADTYIFRPFAHLLFGVLYNVFGMNNLVYYLLKTTFAVLFGAVSYLLLCRLTNNRKLSFVSSLFAMLLPSVIISVNKIPEIEVIASVFLLAAFLEYIKLEKLRKINKAAIIHISFFLILALAGILFKETVRIYVFLFIFLYSLFSIKKINGMQKISLSVLAIIVAYFFLAFPPMPTSLTEKMPLSFNHLWFVFNFVSSQFAYPFLIGGSIILFLFSLSKYFELPKISLLLVGVFLLGISLAIPAATPFFWLGTVFFSDGPMIYLTFFSILLLISLFMQYLTGKTYTKLFSAIIIVIFASIIGYLLFFPNSRQIVSIRSFIAISPFLLYMIFDALSQMIGKVRKAKNRLAIMQSALMIVLFLLFSYHMIAASANLGFEKMGFNKANYEGIKYLSSLSLNGTVVFYTNEIFRIDKMDMEAINPKMDADQKFSAFFLNSNKLSGSFDDIKKEICMKTQGYSKDAYILVTKPHPIANESASKILEGDFRWTTRDTFYWLRALPSTAQYFFWPVGYGALESYQKTAYSPKTLLDSYLEKEADLLHEYNESFFQFSTWLEETPYRILNNVPIKTDYNYIANVYYLNTAKLNCDNQYPWETSPDSISYRFMSQDAVITVNNSGASAEKAKLSLTGWSFYKPRMLEIYSNNKLLATYNFSQQSALKEFITPTIDLNPGENKIVLHSREGCDISGDVLKEYKDDKRCISFAFSKMEVIRLKDLGGKIMYENNWYEQKSENNVSFRWMSQNGTLLFFSQKNYTEKIRLDFLAYTFYKTKTLTLYQNEMLIEQYNISGGEHIITPIISLKPGENIIKFNSVEGCDVPDSLGLMNFSSCISIAVGNLEKIEIDKEISYDEKNMFKLKINNQSYNAFSLNTTAYIYNAKDIEQNIVLAFSFWSFNKSRTLEAYLNGKSIGSYNISATNFNMWINKNISIPLTLPPGNSTLMLKSGGCTLFSSQTDNFSECISFAFNEIEPMKATDMEIIYDEKSMRKIKLSNITFSAFSLNTTAYIYNAKDMEQNMTVRFYLWSFNKTRSIEAYLNGKPIGFYNITAANFNTWVNKNISLSLNLAPGNNILMLKASDCTPTFIENSSECISFAFNEIVPGNENKKSISLSFESNWHIPETAKNTSWRWMSQDAVLFVYNLKNAEQETILNFSVWSFYRNRTLEAYLNNAFIGSYRILPDRRQNIEINIQARLGGNILQLVSKEGCEAPKSLGVSSDERCLSFAFADISVKQ